MNPAGDAAPAQAWQPRSWQRSVAWNLAGALLPLAAGLFAIPLLLEHLGVERFGLLNIAWLLVGYFSLFDLGLGRALTRLVAARLANSERSEIPALVVTAMRMMGWLGMGAAAITALLGLLFLNEWLNVPPPLRGEMTQATLLLAASLPMVVLAAGWRGVLEACHRFDWVNWVRIPLGIAMFVAPLLALQIADGLLPVVAALALTRLAGWQAHRWQCLRLLPELAHGQVERRWLAPLFSFGGWLTVSNLVGPLMVYADRFLIGGLVSLAAVAYYSTPYEIVTRLLIVSAAATGVLYPRLASEMATDLAAAARSYSGAQMTLAMVMFPAVAALILLAPEGLQLWLGVEFARESSFAARVLAVGVFFNVLGQVALTVVHAAGKADWSAKLHLFELPLYCTTLYWLGRRYGIDGVAVAWLLRILLDTLIMLAFAETLLLRKRATIVRFLLPSLAAVALLAAGCQFADWRWRAALTVALAMAAIPGLLTQLRRYRHQSAKA